MTALFLARHGQSEWNAQGKIQGQAESALTVLGRRQAAFIGGNLAEILRGMRLRVFASPLSRASDTAAIICEALDGGPHAVTLDERINDFKLGVLTGYPGWDVVAAEYPELARLRLEDPLKFHPDQGESGTEVFARVGDFLADLPTDADANLVVCHGVINKFIRAVRRGITGSDIIALGESQYSVFRLDGTQETELDLGISRR